MARNAKQLEPKEQVIAFEETPPGTPSANFFVETAAKRPSSKYTAAQNRRSEIAMEQRLAEVSLDMAIRTSREYREGVAKLLEEHEANKRQRQSEKTSRRKYVVIGSTISLSYAIRDLYNKVKARLAAEAASAEIEEKTIRNEDQIVDAILLEGYFDFHEVPKGGREALIERFRLTIELAKNRASTSFDNREPDGAGLPSFEKPAPLKTRRRTPSAELDAQVQDLGRVRAAQQLLTTYQRRKGVDLTESEIEQLRAARRLVRAYERRTPAPG